MYARSASIGLKGMEGYIVQVEVRASIGTDSIIIAGLPDASVKESTFDLILKGAKFKRKFHMGYRIIHL
ncbi:hypothetical protein SFC50_03095 [Bacillus infantis]|uniref:hypothetical protein n=1 Tax=Bacillus infantis TaxID=324767 RepID=UPI0039829A53